VYGDLLDGSTASVLGFETMGGSLSVRSFTRIGKHVSVTEGALVASQVSVNDSGSLGSSLSVFVFVRCESSDSIGAFLFHGIVRFLCPRCHQF
jgi:acyl-[acyl carrier protein]--UDP-N-acetylglucosamine O-acyltransferase